MAFNDTWDPSKIGTDTDVADTDVADIETGWTVTEKEWSGPDAEFPKAINPKEWYAFPPIEAGAPKPFHETRLGQLATELRLEILRHVNLKPGYREQAECYRGYRGFFSEYRPEQLSSALQTCRQLRKDALAHLLLSSTHIPYRSDGVWSLSREIKTNNCTWIRFIALQADADLVVKHEGCFPSLLETLCRDLPSLIRFQLFANLHANAEPLEERKPHNPPITLAQQQVRALLRFGAFLVLRHPNLDLLLWPGDSKTQSDGLDPQTWTERAYIDVMANSLRVPRKAIRETLAWVEEEVEVTCEDHVLDATAIRRLTWSELATANMEDFHLHVHEKPTTSNVFESHDHFRKVDREGYMTRERRAKLKKRFIPVDGMIMMGRKQMDKANREL